MTSKPDNPDKVGMEKTGSGDEAGSGAEAGGDEAGSRIKFYRVTHAKSSSILLRLLLKAQAETLRALVVLPDKARMRKVDDELWTLIPDSFLPHAIAGEGATKGGDDSVQPILLSLSADNASGADILVAIDCFPEVGADFSRCYFLFDGQDEDMNGQARSFWQFWKGRGEAPDLWELPELRASR